MKSGNKEAAALEMPCGKVIKLARLRSEGVLSGREVDFLRRAQIPLAYDPMQIGWLPTTTIDDFDNSPVRSNRAETHRSVAHKPQVNALHPQYRLRSWELSDLETYRTLLDDRSVWKYMPETYPDPLTADIAAALIELSNNSNHHQVFAVLRDTRIVGQVRLLYDVDETDPAKAEISYWLGRPFWGKGIGSDVVRLFTKRCFADNGGINTLIARVHRENSGSFAVLRKAGFGQDRIDPANADWILLSCTR
jgi:RimJ/RimL family protein N-acetyltransferase